MSDNTTWNGYPPNLTSNGFYWIKFSDEVLKIIFGKDAAKMSDIQYLPAFWSATYSQWDLGGGTFRPSELAEISEFITFIGPCVPPRSEDNE